MATHNQTQNPNQNRDYQGSSVGSSTSSPSSTGTSSYGSGSQSSTTTSTYGSPSTSSSVGRGSQQHQEGRVARAIEQQTAKLPSDVFLWTAGACFIGAAALKFSGRGEDANFVAQMTPAFLILGLYNKVVKRFGSDPGGAGRDSSLVGV
jgi:hypothetical protein